MSDSPTSSKGSLALRHLLLPVLLLALAAGASWKLSQMSEAPAQKQPLNEALLVETRPLALGVEQTHITGFGRVRPWRKSELSTEVGGRIIKVNDKLQDGAVLEKGEELVVIDDADFKTAQQQAEAELALLKAQTEKLELEQIAQGQRLALAKEALALAEQEWSRHDKLFAAGAISSRQELDRHLRAKLQQQDQVLQLAHLVKSLPLQIQETGARRGQAEARADQSRRDIARCVVRAPFKGRVQGLAINLGQVVRAGQALAALHDDSRLEVPIGVKLDELKRWVPLSQDKDWLVFTGSPEVGLLWEPGSVEVLGRARGVLEAGGQSGMVQVLVEIPPDSPLRAGMHVGGRIRGVDIHGCARIPAGLLGEEGEIHVAREKEGGPVLARVPVEVLKRDGDDVLVRGNVLPGDSLITTRVQLAAEGRRLLIRKPAAN